MNPAHEERRLAQLRSVAPDITRALGKGPPMIPKAADRTPCVRCGVRADVGCAHSAQLVANYFCVESFECIKSSMSNIAHLSAA